MQPWKEPQKSWADSFRGLQKSWTEILQGQFKIKRKAEDSPEVKALKEQILKQNNGPD